MAATLWGAWSQDWALYNKVDFDGINKIIYVHAEVNALDIRTEVYSAWIDWVTLRDNSKFLPSIRYTGYDPIGGGAYTGDSYFLINGWKLSVDLSKVRVTGVLFSDDYPTAYYTPSMVAQYPATVAALVNTIQLGGTSATEIWAHPTRTLDTAVPTAQQNADAVWVHSFANKLLTVAKFLGLK